MKTTFIFITSLFFTFILWGQNKNPIDEFFNGQDSSTIFEDNENLSNQLNKNFHFDTTIIKSFTDSTFQDMDNISFGALFQEMDKMLQQLAPGLETMPFDSSMIPNMPMDLNKLFESFGPMMEFNIPEPSTQKKKKNRKKYSL